VLLNLSTDRYEASRGLSATAELLVFKVYQPPVTTPAGGYYFGRVTRRFVLHNGIGRLV